MIRLEDLGFDEFFSSQPSEAIANMEGMVRARVAREDRQGYVLLMEGAVTARGHLGGGLRYRAASAEDLPAVGDWVVARWAPGEELAAVVQVYDRRACLMRQVAGERSDAQVIGANVDVVFIVTSMNQEFEPRRLERYLLAVHESGASPVLVLNKADLADDPSRYVDQAEAVAAGAPVVAMSALGEDARALAPWLERGRTVALVGSSGVGKSTIINRLLGQQAQQTSSIREDDDEGRHTTTARHLLVMPQGRGVLIDTPGMRELQLWAGELDADVLFEDIAALAEGCRFRDCQHDTEPGCAVQQAIEEGRLDERRLWSWRKLERELEWNRRRQDVAAERAHYREWAKMVRAHKKPTW